MNTSVEISSEVVNWANQIRRHHAGAAHSILEAAKVCYESDKALSTSERQELIKLLPFDKSTYSKMVTLGADERLHSDRLLPLLPSSFSTIYELSHLSNEELDSAIEGDKLHPKVTRSAVVSWRRRQKTAAGQLATGDGTKRSSKRQGKNQTTEDVVLFLKKSAQNGELPAGFYDSVKALASEYCAVVDLIYLNDAQLELGF